MARQEILCWTSLIVSASIIVFYVLFVFGWPDFLPDYSAQAIKIFFNLFWIALAVEIFIGITEKNTKVEKDERDFFIESMGIRYAYYFLVSMAVILMGHFFMNMIFEKGQLLEHTLTGSTFSFHALFIILITASIIKRITMLYHYRKYD